MKVIGRFPGETSCGNDPIWPHPCHSQSCLSLAWAVLDLVVSGARGLGLSDLDRRQLKQPREHPWTLIRTAAEVRVA